MEHVSSCLFADLVLRTYIDDFVSTQVKVFTEPSFMELAVEQFLGKSEADVKVVFCF